MASLGTVWLPPEQILESEITVYSERQQIVSGIFLPECRFAVISTLLKCYFIYVYNMLCLLQQNVYMFWLMQKIVHI